MTTTAEEVWQLLGELIQAQKETERCFQETEHRFQETERLHREQSRKTDRQIQQVNEQLGKLGNRLGEFVQWQVRPAAVRLFQEQGIDIHELYIS